MYPIKMQFDDVEIAVKAIAQSAIQTRAEREGECVAALVRELYGPEACKSNLPSGKPVISIDGRASFPCSISHCRTHAVVARTQSGQAIGIDMETYRETLRHVAGRFLSESEQLFYIHGQRELLAAWTMKEAVYKAAGISPLPFTEISLPSSDTFMTGLAYCRAAGMSFKVLYCDYLPLCDGVFISLVKRCGRVS